MPPKTEVYCVIKCIPFEGYVLPSLITCDKKQADNFLNTMKAKNPSDADSWEIFTYKLGVPE